MESQKRLQWLDILKFFGISAVILGHIYTFQPVLDWLYTFHVPLFFITGGIVFRPKKITDDIRARAFKILVPYLLFGVVIATYYAFLERQFREVDMSLTDCLLGLLIGDMEHLAFHSHLWFLPCYFLTSVVYNLLYRLVKPLACRLVCAATALAYVLLPIPSLPWGADRMLGFLGLFALGELTTEKCFAKKLEKLPAAVKITSAAVLTAVSITLSCLRLITGIMWIVCAVVGTAGFALLSMALEKARLPAAAGRMTIVILCIHGPVYRILIKLVSLVSGVSSDDLRGNILAALAFTAVTLAICCGIYIILSKILPWSVGIYPKKRQTS